MMNEILTLFNMILPQSSEHREFCDDFVVCMTFDTAAKSQLSKITQIFLYQCHPEQLIQLSTKLAAGAREHDKLVVTSVQSVI